MREFVPAADGESQDAGSRNLGPTLFLPSLCVPPLAPATRGRPRPRTPPSTHTFPRTSGRGFHPAFGWRSSRRRSRPRRGPVAARPNEIGSHQRLPEIQYENKSLSTCPSVPKPKDVLNDKMYYAITFITYFKGISYIADWFIFLVELLNYHVLLQTFFSSLGIICNASGYDDRLTRTFKPNLKVIPSTYSCLPWPRWRRTCPPLQRNTELSRGRSWRPL